MLNHHGLLPSLKQGFTHQASLQMPEYALTAIQVLNASDLLNSN